MGALKEFSIKTDKTGVYNITGMVQGFIVESKVESGIAVIYCPHTTAAITLNENTDVNVGRDLLVGIDEAFPDRDDFKHSEGNSYAHLRSSAIGGSVTIIIEDGWPKLGIWQNIFFLEFDGPRDRTFYVKIMSD